MKLDATTLSVCDARRLFGITEVDDILWNEIEEMKVPTYLTEGIARISAVTSPSVKGTEAYSRMIIDQIIISSIWEENLGDGKRPVAIDSQHQLDQEDPALLQLRHETPIQRKVNFKGEDRLLCGSADYSVWYDTRESNLATNLIIVAAKKSGWTDLCLPQLTAYMGAVHDIRKEEGKTNSTVFGVATDGNMYRFCRIDNDGRWSESFLLEWKRKEQKPKIFAIFRHLIRIAALSSPSTSPTKNPQRRERILAEFGTPTRLTRKDFGLKGLKIIEIYSDDSEYEIVSLPSRKKGKHGA